MCLLAKFGDYRSSRTGDTNFYINSYMKKYLEKVTLTTSIRHIAQCTVFKIRNNQFTIHKSQIRLAEKRDEEEHRKLQSVLRQQRLSTNKTKQKNKS